uniref:cell division protein FtsQ/DivIB n=1 Tax=Dokdonella sp. TaxID=2291710 RepID=UPI0026053ADC
WPDVVDLVVYEQQPYAHWGTERLISRNGKIFSVAGAEGVQGLPRLSGPDERVADVLQFYADSLKEFSGSGLAIAGVVLSPRGGWKLELASGAVVEIGRDDTHRRVQRFLDVWPRLAGSKPTPPNYIDLRYENGFVVRWTPENAAGGAAGQDLRKEPPPAGGGAAPGLDALAAHPESRPSRFSNPEFRIPAPP